MLTTYTEFQIVLCTKKKSTAEPLIAATFGDQEVPPWEGFIYIYICSFFYQKSWSEKGGGTINNMISIENMSSSKYIKHGLLSSCIKIRFNKIRLQRFIRIISHLFLQNIFETKYFKPSCDEIRFTY